jgi:exodeoxyribonuclease VII large subunit
VQARRHGYAQAEMRFERCSPQGRVERESQHLLTLWKRLQSVSPESVLKRGFVIVRDAEGKPVTRRAEVKKGQRLRAEFADGEAGLRAEGAGGE